MWKIKKIPRYRPTWFSILFTAIKRFWGKAYKAPVWRAAAAILCASFGVWITLLLSKADDQANYQNTIDEMKIRAEDQKRSMDLIGQVIADLNVAMKVREDFRLVVKDIFEGKVRREKAIEDHNLAINAKQQLDDTLKTMKGTLFRVPAFTERYQKMVEELLPYVEDLIAIERIYTIYLENNQSIPQQHDLLQQFHLSVKQLLAHDDKMKTSIAVLQSLNLQIKAENDAEMLKFDKNIDSYVLKSRLRSGIYLIWAMFGVAVFVGVRNQLKAVRRVKSRPQARYKKPRRGRKKH